MPLSEPGVTERTQRSKLRNGSKEGPNPGVSRLRVDQNTTMNGGWCSRDAAPSQPQHGLKPCAHGRIRRAAPTRWAVFCYEPCPQTSGYNFGRRLYCNRMLCAMLHCILASHPSMYIPPVIRTPAASVVTGTLTNTISLQAEPICHTLTSHIELTCGWNKYS